VRIVHFATLHGGLPAVLRRASTAPTCHGPPHAKLRRERPAASIDLDPRNA